MRHRIFWLICLAATLGMGPVSAANAQDHNRSANSGPAHDVPARNANVYDGTAHEPDAQATTQRESAAGIAGSEAAQRRETDAVEQIYKQLQRNTGRPSGGARD
jgi:hypothetical protein